MKGKVQVDYALFKINEMFRVVDISNPLVIAKDKDEAVVISLNRKFDRVPIKKDGKILTYYDSNLKSETEIKTDYILSNSVGILQTFIYLSKRDFYFILSGNELTHIVHYSDLNRPLSLIAIYTQIAYCEMAIRNFARKENNDNTINGIVGFLNKLNDNIKSNVKIKVQNAKSQFEQKVESVQTDVFDELYFDDELLLFRELVDSRLDSSEQTVFKTNIINLDDQSIKCFKDLRNEIMHAKPVFIHNSTDVGKWLKFLQGCQFIISVIDGKTVFLQ